MATLTICLPYAFLKMSSGMPSAQSQEFLELNKQEVPERTPVAPTLAVVGCGIQVPSPGSLVGGPRVGLPTCRKTKPIPLQGIPCNNALMSDERQTIRTYCMIYVLT